MPKPTHNVDFYTIISKVDENNDGTLTISGFGSTEEVDADGEVIKAESIAACLPEYMKYGSGNLREMHQMSAVGIVTKAEVNDKGQTLLTAQVTDPVAVIKVKTKTYKGFSVRGKAFQDSTNPKILHMHKITEWSLVDRPNNSGSLIHTMKIEGGGDGDWGDPKPAPTKEVIKTEAVKVKKNQLALALAALQENLVIAHALRGVEVMKSLAADETQWDEADLPKRRELLDGAEKILNVAKSLGPASLEQDIQKAVGSSTSEASQEVVKALTDAAKVQSAELGLVVEAAKAFGMPETTTTEQFIAKMFTTINELKAMPGAAKGVKTVVVSKGEDMGQKEGEGETQIAPVRLPGSKEEDKIATEIKKIHAGGGTPYGAVDIVG